VGLRDSRRRKVAGRDSKNPDGGALIFHPGEWKIYLSQVWTTASHSWRCVGVRPTWRLVCDAITQ
jgi:hypothetical protein